MMKETGIGLGGILFVLFLILKLTGYIDWSWWWVTAPLWIPFAIAMIFLVFILAVSVFREVF